MSATQGIRAGRAFVELFADDSKLVRGLKRAEAKLKAFGERVSALGRKMFLLGAAVATPLVAAARTYAKMGDDLAKMSKRTGVSVEALSELAYAAQISGADVGDLEKGLRRMQKTIAAAAQGSASAQEALAKLGIATEDILRLSPEQQFKLIADRLSQIADPTLRAALALEVFGRSGAKLLPLLKDGAAGIEALQAEARRLGLTISTKDARAAEEFGDVLTRLKLALRQVVFTVGSALAPVLTQAANWIIRTAAKAGEWIKQNKGLIVSIFKIAVGAMVLGAALVALGGIIKGLAVVAGVLAAAFTVLGVVLKVVMALLGVMLTPIGLVVTAIVALGAGILIATGKAGKAVNWLGERFGVLKQDAVDAWEGIGNALAAGDIALAARIMWLTLRMEWIRGVNFLEKLWLNFRNFFIKLGWDIWFGLLGCAEYVWHALVVGWIETTAALAKAWTWFSTGVLKAWYWCGKQLSDAWTWLRKQFDDSFNADAASKSADDWYAQKKTEIDERYNTGMAEAEDRRKQRRERETAVHEQTLLELGRQNLDKHRELDDEYNKRMSDNEEELKKAREEWKKSLEAARKAREAGEPPATSPAVKPFISPGQIAEALKAAQKIAVQGTFNVSSVLGLQAAGPTDRLVKEAEEANNKLAKILDELRRGDDGVEVE